MTDNDDGHETPPDGSLPELLAGDDMMQQALEVVNAELAKAGGPTDFSPGAVQEFLFQNSENIKEPAVRAIRLARKAGLDVVSSTHVREAANALAAQSSSWTKNAALAIGGVAAGGGLQELIRLMNTTSAINKQEIAITIVLLVIGTALLVLGLVPRVRR